MRERHGSEWQPEEIQALKEAIEGGQPVANVALALGRSERASTRRSLAKAVIRRAAFAEIREKTLFRSCLIRSRERFIARATSAIVVGPASG